MTQDHGLGERIYKDMKELVLTGSLAPHMKLDFAALAEQLQVSTTPVREAAMRLLGEGLLELHPKGGVRPITASEHRLRGLLDLHGRLANLALDWSDLSVDPMPFEAVPHERATRRFFRTLAQGTGNVDFVDIIERLADRLASFRHREQRVLSMVDGELRTLLDTAADPRRLRRALRTYHRRRIAAVAPIVWLMHSEPGDDR